MIHGTPIGRALSAQLRREQTTSLNVTAEIHIVQQFWLRPNIRKVPEDVSRKALTLNPLKVRQPLTIPGGVKKEKSHSAHCKPPQNVLLHPVHHNSPVKWHSKVTDTSYKSPASATRSAAIAPHPSTSTTCIPHHACSIHSHIQVHHPPVSHTMHADFSYASKCTNHLYRMTRVPRHRKTARTEPCAAHASYSHLHNRGHNQARSGFYSRLPDSSQVHRISRSSATVCRARCQLLRLMSTLGILRKAQCICTGLEFTEKTSGHGVRDVFEKCVDSLRLNVQYTRCDMGR